jgi:hypothetical protein
MRQIKADSKHEEIIQVKNKFKDIEKQMATQSDIDILQTNFKSLDDIFSQ